MTIAPRPRRLRDSLLTLCVIATALGGCSSDTELGQRLFEFTPMFRYGCNTRHHDRGDAPVMRPPVITNQKRSLPPATAGKSLLDEYSPRDSVAGEANT